MYGSIQAGLIPCSAAYNPKTASEMCISISSIPFDSFGIDLIRCKNSQCPLCMQIQK